MSKLETRFEVDSDAHLSDHEWRKKQAAEGRAIYSYPGMEADMAEKKVQAKEVSVPMDDRTRLMTVHFYEAERKRAAAAADAMPYALSDASNVFQLIHEGLSLGHFDAADRGVISLANICAQHFRRLAENEGEHLAQLHMRLEAATSAEAQGEHLK